MNLEWVGKFRSKKKNENKRKVKVKRGESFWRDDVGRGKDRCTELADESTVEMSQLRMSTSTFVIYY